jgi:tetratricopeptide (TPR) repeat protein
MQARGLERVVLGLVAVFALTAVGGAAPCKEPPPDRLDSKLRQRIRDEVALGEWMAAYGALRNDEAGRHCLETKRFGYSIDRCWQLATGLRDTGNPNTVYIYQAYALAAVGLPDLALEIVDRADTPQRHTVDRIRAEVAHDAAMGFLTAGDFESALGYFQVPAQGGTHAAPKQFLENVRRLVESPYDVATRLEIARDLRYVQVRQSYGWLVDWLIRDERLHPTERERRDILAFLHEFAAHRAKRGWSTMVETAQDVLDELLREFPGDPVTDQALLRGASVDAATGQGDRAEERYRILVQSGRINDATSRAYLLLAELRRRAGDHESAESLLKALIELPPASDETTERRVASHRESARERMAHLYKEQRRFAKALEAHRALGPVGHWCGTCRRSITEGRSLFVAECLVGLGRDGEALEQHIIPALESRASGSRDFASLAVRVYEERGELDDLVKLTKSASGDRTTAGYTHHLALLHLAAARRDVDYLIDRIVPEHCEHLSFSYQASANRLGTPEFRPNPAVTLISRVGPGAVPRLIERFHGPSPDPDEASVSHRHAQRLWILLALSLIDDSRAAEFLQELDQSAQERRRGRARKPLAIDQNELRTIELLSKGYR